MQPIRPQDATSIYQRQAVQGAADASSAAAGAAARRVGGATGNGGRRADRVSVSPEGLELYRAMQAVDQHSDVRTDRVDALREQIDNGTYKVDAFGVARRLVEDGFTA